ncbi:hypothetical protein BGZ99_006701 [Dissophora globulifera]|uniref:Glutathione S-transferase n=1 Tax=Dissophora globulifera TaxID=979702 RepID=A0A9P6US17_9FUNG|nr:hypothetical protein BGZ99_006701 [Dissophora globulifera]
MKVYDIDCQENSKLVTSKSIKYTLTYFDFHFGGMSARALLAYGGADWTPLYPDWEPGNSNWPFDERFWEADRKKTPFGSLPILKIIGIGEGGTERELMLGENFAIDQFLAKQFGLQGENSWEEALINSFYASADFFFYREMMVNFFWRSATKSDEEKAIALNTFLTKDLSAWCNYHEVHLKNNHQNGYYVGNRTTLADIRTTTLLEALPKIIGVERFETVINETNTPGILKVVASVRSKPSYAAWINSDEYKRLDSRTTAFVKLHHPELL